MLSTATCSFLYILAKNPKHYFVIIKNFLKKREKVVRLKAVLLATVLMMPISGAEVLASQPLSGLFSSKSKTKFLPVNQAFKVSATQNGDTLTVRFHVTEGHYIYKDKLSLALPDGVTAGAWQFDRPSSMVDDPEFGKVAVFEHDVVATTKLTSTDAVNDTARLTWQGCAKAGLCYPPERVSVRVEMAAPKTPNKDQSELVPDTQKTPKTPDVKSDSSKTAKPNLADTKAKSKTSETAQKPLSTPDVSNKTPDNIADNNTVANTSNALSASADAAILSNEPVAATSTAHSSIYELNHTPEQTSSVGGFGLDKNPILAIILLFLAGVALAFTACVYPMIPIVANIVAKSHSPSAMRGFVLTSAYGLGVATSYGLLGAAVAWFGRSLGIVGWLQNPWILLGFAGFFVLLALHMWGLVRLSLPSLVKNKLTRSSQSADRHLGRVYGSFLVGVLSALVVSPCVSAPLAGALWAVSVQGNVLLGFVALFVLGLGLSLPLVVLGTTQGGFMPKAGRFMEDVKHFGGLMLLAVAILLANRVFLTSWMLVLWALWLMMMAVFLYRLGRLPFVALGLVSGVWSALVMIGASLGSQDPWQPLSVLTTKDTQIKSDIKVHTLQELDKILTSTPKVLIDVTADWCIECKIMEKTLFTNRPAALTDWQVVKLDITETTDDSRAILARYELFGPPALLYYQEGKLIQKQLGEVSRSDFELALMR